MAKASTFVLFLLAATCLNSMALPSRKMLKEEDDGFRVELIHPDSPHSPFIKPTATRLERIKTMIARSHAQVSTLIRKMSKEASTLDYQSPLSPLYGGYVMELTVGTPGQKFKAVVDTASDLVWLQTNLCSGCSGEIFKPDDSSSFSTITCSNDICHKLPNYSCGTNSSCNFLYEYQTEDESTSGTFAYETITLSTTTGGTKQIPNFAIGCGAKIYGFYGIDGVVGLGQGPISFPSQLSSTIKNKFSYCMVDIFNPNKTSPLLFGDAATLKGSGIQSTPILPNYNTTYYLVDMQDIEVGGNSLGNPGTTILHSGTPLTYIPETMYASVVTAFKEAITLKPLDGSEIGLDLCYDISRNRNYKFPELTIKFAGGATLTPPSANYFIVVDEELGTACLALASAENVPLSIIGSIMQQSLHILFDRDASVLSYVPASCESL